MGTDGPTREALHANDAVWARFYRDGKSLGEIAEEFGCSLYDLSPWLTAPMLHAIRQNPSMPRFPPHKASLYLTHNNHKSYYQTVVQSIEQDDHGYHESDWISLEQKALAIHHNECWTVQWYPETPVGFCTASAYSLEALLAHVNKETSDG